MAGYKVVPIPASGTVAGRPRKEPLYDSECYKAATAVPTSVTVFSNFATFNVAPTNIGSAKVLGRDSNLQGGNAGLPQGHLFYWYGWRLKYRTMDANLGSAANVVMSEQLNRLRELSDVLFKFTSGEYIRVQADELPSGTGPAFINSTHTSATVMSLPSGVPDKRNFKDVTVSGKPQEITQLEAFRVVLGTSYSTGLTPTVDIFASPHLEGVLIRGVT